MSESILFFFFFLHAPAKSLLTKRKDQGLAHQVGRMTKSTWGWIDNLGNGPGPGDRVENCYIPILCIKASICAPVNNDAFLIDWSGSEREDPKVSMVSGIPYTPLLY